MTSGRALGRRPDLIGGGLIRSANGWENVLSLRKDGIFQKSDERILGDSGFVESVLAEADEKVERQCALKSRGIHLDHLFGSSGLSVLLADEGIFRLMEGIGFEFEEVIIPEAVSPFLKRPDFIVGAFQGAG